MLSEPVKLLQQAIVITGEPPEPVELVSRIFTHENAEAHIRDAVR